MFFSQNPKKKKKQVKKLKTFGQHIANHFKQQSLFTYTIYLRFI